MCLECRRARPGYHGKWEPKVYDVRRCDVCQRSYQPRRPQSRTCSPVCAKERKRTYKRNLSSWRAAMIRASASAPDPLTPDHEAAMRRAAKRCSMPGCGVKLADKPFLPNSKELDHIVPRRLGGAHTIGNTRIICRSCNVRRPDDGSDIGQLDLFSMLDPVAVAVAQQRRAYRPQQYKVVRHPSRPRACKNCGTAIRAPRRWCESCLEVMGRRCAEARANLMAWQDISDMLGLSGTGTAYALAVKYGEQDVLARWPKANLSATGQWKPWNASAA